MRDFGANSEAAGLRRRLVAALGFGFLVDSAEEQALPMLFPAIRSSLGLSYGSLSLINGVRVILQTAAGPVWGVMADRFSRKRILVWGTGLWGVWTLACGVVTTFHQLLVLRIVACLGLGCLYPAAFSMLADSFGPNKRGQAMAAVSAVGMLGIVAAAAGFGVILGGSEEGWRWAFVLLGSMSIVSGAVIALCVKEPVRGASEPELSGLLSQEGSQRFSFQWNGLRRVLWSPTVWVNMIHGIFLITPINALAAFFVVWVVDERGVSQEAAPAAFGGVVLSLAFGAVVGGWMADRADSKWPQRGRIAVGQLSMALTLPALLFLFTTAQSRVALIGSSLFAGFFLDWTRRGVKQPLVQNVIVPELRSSAMAFTEFLQGSAASLAIFWAGKRADETGLGPVLLALVCGSWLLGLLTMSFYYVTYPREARMLREEMEERRRVFQGSQHR